MINFISWCIFGLIAGTVAKILVPGRDPMGCFATIALGVIGSITGGFLGSVLFGGSLNEIRPAGLIMSVIGGIVVLLILRQVRRPRVDS